MEPPRPSVYAPLARRFGDERAREFEETRLAWTQADALWSRSPLGTTTLGERVRSFMESLLHGHGPTPAAPLMLAIWDAVEAIFRAENVGPIEPIWEAIASDVLVAVNFRNVLARRRRYAVDYNHTHGLITTQLTEACGDLFAALPESCFRAWPDDGSAFEVPLIELVDEPAALIERLFIFPYTDEIMQRELFLELREAHTRNLLVASGFPPDTNPHDVSHKLIMPPRQRDKSPAELVEMYLGGTPFAKLLELPVPLHMPDEVRFEHAHILGGTGHGKTQLLQRMIHADLVAARNDGRSVVVIDSQGDLINKLIRLDLFDPDQPGSLSDRLVLVDPSDIEFPAALNLFDAHLSRVADYRPVDRERVLNGAVELYETLFGDMLGAELTQKQGVVFRYLARLMVTIPGATIHTLMRLMEDGKPFKADMERLEGSARYFFETEFFHPSFAATKKQILRRLWGVLSTPAFERMFAQPTNKIDLFEATRTGKIIFVSTAKDLLKSDGSALLGRFFIRMIAQAALERSVLDPWERTPTFVYVDEAQEYFDEGVEAILQQARKYQLSFVCAHQSLDQASPRLRSALFANTSLKCAGGVSAKDARALADELYTTPEFIGSMKRRGGRTEFAAWIKNWTPGAVRLSVPLGFLERQPTITEEQLDEVVARNRLRYCGTLEEARSAYASPVVTPAVPSKVPPEPSVEPIEEAPAAEVSPAEPPMQEAPAYAWPSPHEARPSPPITPPAERELGKGGKKHRYLQNLVKGLAEQHGFRATIEAPISGGQIDVLLARDDLSVAVEVSVTTPVEWERQNLRKCLAAGYPRVLLVLAKSERTARTYRERVVEGLSEEDRERLSILYPDELPDFMASLDPAVEPTETIVKGYRVKVSQTAVSPEDAKARRGTLARLVSQSLNRQQD